MLFALADKVVERSLVRDRDRLVFQVKTAAVEVERDGLVQVVFVQITIALDAVVPFLHPVIEPGERLDREADIHIFDAEMPQPGEASGDVERDVIVAAAAGHPRPTAVGVLCLGELLEQPFCVGVEAVFVKQYADVAPGLAFVLGLSHPRRFEQEQTLEVLVFLERTIERVGALPQVEHTPNAWVGVGDVRGERVGVQPVETLLGALVRILHQVGQGEHGVPGGVGCHLHGERLVLERVRLVGGDQFVELKFLRALVTDRQRQRFGDEDAAGEHGQIVFLGICLVARRGSDSVDKCRRAVGHGEAPRKTARLPGGNCERLLRLGVAEQSIGIVVSDGVFQVEFHGAGAGGFAGVQHARGELQHISLAEKTRRVRAHHQVERCDSLAVDEPGANLFVVHERHQLPLR